MRTAHTMVLSIDTCSKWDEEEEVLACASLTGMGRWRRGAGDEYVRLCGGVVGVGCEARRGGRQSSGVKCRTTETQQDATLACVLADKVRNAGRA
jgi:hypothetical protein